MSLSLVVPVRDDGENLGRLARQAAATGLFSEMVIADDASEVPVTAAALGLPEDAGMAVTVLREETPRGAGNARNRALEAAGGELLLFFDSDDLLRPELADVVRGLEGAAFDFCMFSFRISAMTEEGRPGPYPADARRWREADAPARPAPMTDAQRGTLARVSNYPWNKIYRRAFLLENDIRCTEVPVHNDIALHWSSFLRAEAPWVSALQGAEHVTSRGGARLTNRRGLERLEVLPALAGIAREAARDRSRRHLVDFAAFFVDLMIWMRWNIDPLHHDALDAAAARTVETAFPPPVHALVALENPAAARWLTEALA